MFHSSTDDEQPIIIFIALVFVLVIIFAGWWAYSSATDIFKNYVNSNPYDFGGWFYWNANLPYIIVVVLIVAAMIAIIYWLYQRGSLVEYRTIRRF
nr:hypothetical protein [Candidatus Freyarchaeota archaeon]